MVKRAASTCMGLEAVVAAQRGILSPRSNATLALAVGLVMNFDRFSGSETISGIVYAALSRSY